MYFTVSPSPTTIHVYVTATTTAPTMTRSTLNGTGFKIIITFLPHSWTLHYPTPFFLFTGCESGLVIVLGVGIVAAYFLGMGTTAALMLCYHFVIRGAGLYATGPA